MRYVGTSTNLEVEAVSSKFVFLLHARWEADKRSPSYEHHRIISYSGISRKIASFFPSALAKS